MNAAPKSAADRTSKHLAISKKVGTNKFDPMIIVTDKKINEIYQDLDCGMICYYNPLTEEIKSLPDFNSNIFAEEEMWKDVLIEIDANRDKFIRFEPMESNEFFRMMEGFIDSIDNLRLKERLIHALNGRNPFRNFKYEIDNSGEYRQIWFDYKEQTYCELIKDQIDALNFNEDQ